MGSSRSRLLTEKAVREREALLLGEGSHGATVGPRDPANAPVAHRAEVLDAAMFSDGCDAPKGVYEFRVHPSQYSHCVEIVKRQSLISF
jgi:hypothetical protein